MKVMCVGAVLGTLLSSTQLAVASEQSVWSGVYSKEQVVQGQSDYDTTCADGCHESNLMGSGPTPSLRGDDFLLRWTDFSLAEFLELMETTMPKDEAGRLTTDRYLAVIAYILSANGFPPGDATLRRSDALNEIFITEAP